ncbi:hypothetical protein BD310DRAFT_329178 [Dichomitus squalens]|uniref:Uncharacterized protein n=1 Tax=Dichomitus squalens TaxID=114155 RepID=A0A4Q9PZV9_9APHY|nr:hypothetical protein BD310DRAFT_329178 [Dichomitus squalens]
MAARAFVGEREISLAIDLVFTYFDRTVRIQTNRSASSALVIQIHISAERIKVSAIYQVKPLCCLTFRDTYEVRSARCGPLFGVITMNAAVLNNQHQVSSWEGPLGRHTVRRANSNTSRTHVNFTVT